LVPLLLEQQDQGNNQPANAFTFQVSLNAVAHAGFIPYVEGSGHHHEE